MRYAYACGAALGVTVLLLLLGLVYVLLAGVATVYLFDVFHRSW